MFDEDITSSFYEKSEIKELNKTRTKCVKCKTNTKTGFNFMYCPNDCDVEFIFNLDLDL